MSIPMTAESLLQITMAARKRKQNIANIEATSAEAATQPYAIALGLIQTEMLKAASEGRYEISVNVTEIFGKDWDSRVLSKVANFLELMDCKTRHSLSSNPDNERLNISWDS